MTTPVWVITGLLDLGETTLINQLAEQELDGLDILVIQFGSGETPLIEQERVKKLAFSESQSKQSPFSIADTIIHYIDKHRPDLILIGWNEMEHFHKLEEMLLQFSTRAVLSIEKVVYVAEGANFRTRIPDAGVTTFSQIAGCGCAYVKLKGNRKSRNGMDVLYGCNPGIRVYTSWGRFVYALFRFGIKPRHWFLMFLAAVMLCMAAFSMLNDAGTLSGRYINMFLGVFPQAAPFLAVGVLLSSLIQVYLKSDWIQRRFPRKILAGQLLAVLAGFCLLVCDCAPIPVLKGLVKKRVPMPTAMTFILVSPVVNPVVTLSTWYTFNSNYKIIAARYGLGILYSVLCGLTYLFKPPVNYLVEDVMPIQVACGDYSLLVEKRTQLSRFSLMIQHAQNESFSVGKFLLTGIFTFTSFQDMIPRAVAAGGTAAPWKALLVITGLAFMLSLCSSSDTVVAKSMAGSLPVGAVLGFLVSGPMMGIKNAAMLLSGFKSGFVIRLFATTLLICFLVIGIFMTGGSGGIRI